METLIENHGYSIPYAYPPLNFYHFIVVYQFMENTTTPVDKKNNKEQELDLSFNLLDVVSSIWRWRKQVLIFVAVVTIGTVIVSFFLSDYYTAYVTIIPANEEKNLFGDGGKNNSLYGDGDAIDRAIIFSESSPLVEYMIQEYDLATRYRINTSTPKGQAKVAKRFRKLYRVKKNQHSGIEISIQDTDPEMSAKMLSSVLSKLEELYKQATAPNKEMILKTYENALAEKKQELDAVYESLITLRRKYKIYDIKTQAELLATLIVNTEGNLAEDKAKLESYRKQSGRQDSITNLIARVSAGEQKLTMLNNQNDSLQSAINLKSYNEGREQIVYFENQIESLNKDISIILSEYTKFKTQANTQAASIIILEAVQVPKIKSYPVRSLLVIGAGFLSIIIGIFGALILDLNKRIDWGKVFNE